MAGAFGLTLRPSSVQSRTKSEPNFVANDMQKRSKRGIRQTIYCSLDPIANYLQLF